MLRNKIVITGKGFLGFWEEGGGMTRSGFAYIVAGPNGEKLTPLYVRKHGQLSCDKHALFLLQPGTLIIAALRSIVKPTYNGADNNVYQIKIYKFDDYDFIEMKEEPYMQPAIEAAKLKTRYYHCRQSVYYMIKEEYREKLRYLLPSFESNLNL